MRRRFAGHLGLSAPDRPLFVQSAGPDPLDQIAFLADRGFAGVFDNFLLARDEAEQETIGRAAAARGLAFGSIALDPDGWLTPLWSGEDRAAQTRVLDRALTAAQRVGSTTATIVTGLDPARPRDAQRAAFTESLRHAADRAAAGGLTLCVEPVPAGFIPGLLVERLAEAAAIVAAVDHPAVRLAYDSGHVAMAGDDPVASLTQAAPHIGLVQLADSGRAALGRGDIDWPAFFAALDRTGYAGLIELEHEIGPSEASEQALLARLATIDGKE